ncbi:MAG: carboxypeptidase-like regulatory domain-containing protein [Candidatus Micrarchaeia archaeon]|jgi:hypothetical protein
MKLPAFLLLLAAGMLLLAGAPSAKYTENLTVQVFDAHFRPVEGALVYVDYELNSVKGNIKTKPKPTNGSGQVNIMFTNYEAIQSETEYAFTLYVKYGSQLASASLIAVDNGNQSFSVHSRAYSMQVDSCIAFVRVFDQAGRPLSANVTMDKAAKATDASGSAFFALPPGNYTLKVERNDLVKNIPVVLANSTGDQSLDVVLSYYNLDIRVQDDRRRPLSARVEVNGVGMQTDSDGMARFGNITTSSPQVIVAYGQGIQRLQPNLQSGQSLEVTFDINRPSIKDQYSTLTASGVGVIRFFVEDSGPEASGIDSVSVSYEVSGAQNLLSVYTMGYNSFEAKIPAQPDGTLVKYTITVSDKAGNSAVGYGDYVVSAGGDGQGGQNASSGVPMPAASSLPNEGIFVGIAVLAVLAFAAIYYFTKKKGDEFSPPPIEPPQAPLQP